MRLWHKFLIPVLPRQQLVSQYREDNSIMKAIAENNTPNHILVNRIMDYPIIHFAAYHSLVVAEMRKRGYQVRKDGIERFNNNYAKLTERTFEEDAESFFELVPISDLFFTEPVGYKDLYWHSDRYYLQCLYNLQEKYDCGGITSDEWKLIQKQAKERGIKWNG